MASIEEAQILRKPPSLVDVATSTVEVQTADLPDIDINSVLFEAAVTLFNFHKYTYAILGHTCYSFEQNE